MFLLYLRLLIFPYMLSTLYDVSAHYSAAAFLSVFGFAALAAMTVFLRSRRVVFFGALWMFIFFLPASGLFPIGEAQIIEHNMYIPSMGFVLAAISFAATVKPQVLIPSACVLIASFAAVVVAWTPVWKDSETDRREAH